MDKTSHMNKTHWKHADHKYHEKYAQHHGDRRMEEKGAELLHVEDLSVQYTSGRKVVCAVNGVSFDLRRGEALALVGESGCGKSTIAKALMKILPDYSSSMTGKIMFDGEDIVAMSEKEMEHIRGNKISMVFQDPMTALNPVKKILTQVSSVIKLHNPELTKGEAEYRAIHMLEKVGITRDRMKNYPHEFSGGQQQRVVVAIGLACDPDLLLADEPTTALDVTIQAQVLEMMTDLIHKTNTAMLMITHNLGIVAQTCDYVAVLYGGEIVEYGSLREVYKNPSHPYTIGLFNALPDINDESGSRLKPIAGIMPEPSDLPKGCKFHTRCPFATECCSDGPVPVVNLGGTHICQCHHIEEVVKQNGMEKENT